MSEFYFFPTYYTTRQRLCEHCSFRTAYAGRFAIEVGLNGEHRSVLGEISTQLTQVTPASLLVDIISATFKRRTTVQYRRPASFFLLLVDTSSKKN